MALGMEDGKPGRDIIRKALIGQRREQVEDRAVLGQTSVRWSTLLFPLPLHVLISTPLHSSPSPCRSEWPHRALRPASSAARWLRRLSPARDPSPVALRLSAPPDLLSRPTRPRRSRSPPRMPTARSRPSTSTDGIPMLPATSPRCRATLLT